MPRIKPTRVFTDNSARRQVTAMLVGLGVVWLVTIVVMLWRPPTEAVAMKLRTQLLRVEASNPEADVNAAIARGNLGLIALNRPEGQKIPGVHDPAAIRKYGVQRIILEPDALPDHEEFLRLQHAAFEYASLYNSLLLKKLEPPLPSTTRSTAPTTAAATQPTAKAH